MNTRNGFSFCGTHIEQLGLHYVPDSSATYVHNFGEVSLQQQTFDGHHGGYFYGTTVKPKTFELRCYFENSRIDGGIFDDMLSKFAIGKSGKLIFDNRPWLWYAATVTSVDTSNLINAWNGFVTISFKCYYPFGRCPYKYLSADTPFQDAVLNRTMLNQELTPPTEIITQDTNIDSEYTFLLYNPGTCITSTIMKLSGNAGKGITIYNKTTGQSCKFVSFSTSNDDYIVCDSMNGKVLQKKNGQIKINQVYHSRGYIDLAPASTVMRDVYVSGQANTNMLITFVNVPDDCIGKYINIQGEWIKITDVVGQHFIMLEKNLSQEFQDTVIIAQMNQLVITLEDGAQLTHLSFDYYPAFR